MSYPHGVSNHHPYFNECEPTELQLLLDDMPDLIRKHAAAVLADAGEVNGELDVSVSMPSVDADCTEAFGSVSLNVSYQLFGGESKAELRRQFYAACEAVGRAGLRALELDAEREARRACGREAAAQLVAKASVA